MLYSLNRAYPSPLPNRIRMPDGSTRTDSSTFTEAEILSAGYVAVDEPPLVPTSQFLGWSGTEWTVRGPNEVETAQRWEDVRAECVRLLAATDYKVIKAVELGLPLDQNVVAYRQALRDIYNDVNGIDPWNFGWPVMTPPEGPAVEEPQA